MSFSLNLESFTEDEKMSSGSALLPTTGRLFPVDQKRLAPIPSLPFDTVITRERRDETWYDKDWSPPTDRPLTAEETARAYAMRPEVVEHEQMMRNRRLMIKGYKLADGEVVKINKYVRDNDPFANTWNPRDTDDKQVEEVITSVPTWVNDKTVGFPESKELEKEVHTRDGPRPVNPLERRQRINDGLSLLHVDTLRSTNRAPRDEAENAVAMAQAKADADEFWSEVLALQMAKLDVSPTPAASDDDTPGRRTYTVTSIDVPEHLRRYGEPMINLPFKVQLFGDDRPSVVTPMPAE